MKKKIVYGTILILIATIILFSFNRKKNIFNAKIADFIKSEKLYLPMDILQKDSNGRYIHKIEADSLTNEKSLAVSLESIGILKNIGNGTIRLTDKGMRYFDKKTSRICYGEFYFISMDSYQIKTIDSGWNGQKNKQAICMITYYCEIFKEFRTPLLEKFISNNTNLGKTSSQIVLTYSFGKWRIDPLSWNPEQNSLEKK